MSLRIRVFFVAALAVLVLPGTAAAAEPPFRALSSFDRIAVAGSVGSGQSQRVKVLVTIRPQAAPCLQCDLSKTLTLSDEAVNPVNRLGALTWSPGAASLAITEELLQVNLGLPDRMTIREFPTGALVKRLDTEFDAARTFPTGPQFENTIFPRDVGPPRWLATGRIVGPISEAGIVSILPDGSSPTILTAGRGTSGVGGAASEDQFGDGRQALVGGGQTQPDGTRFRDLSYFDGTFHQLTDSALIDEASPAVSPDGKRIAYLTGNQLKVLAIINTDGTGNSLITPQTDIGYSDPTWSADGRRIAWLGTSTMSGRRALYSIKPDGTDLVRHTQLIGTIADPNPYTGMTSGQVAWGQTCVTFLACSASLTVAQTGPTGFQIVSRPTLASAAEIGFLIERYRGRKLRRVGRVPFGRKSEGRTRVRWNLKLDGRRVKPGRYRISLRALAAGVPVDIARRVDLVIPKRGEPRVTRARVKR